MPEPQPKGKREAGTNDTSIAATSYDPSKRPDSGDVGSGGDEAVKEQAEERSAMTPREPGEPPNGSYPPTTAPIH